MKSNFTWTIASCVVVMLVAVSLYVNKMTTKVHLSSEQLKDMGLYLIEPPRNLGSFNLIDSGSKEFLPKDFEGKVEHAIFWFHFLSRHLPHNHEYAFKNRKRIRYRESGKNKNIFWLQWIRIGIVQIS